MPLFGKNQASQQRFLDWSFQSKSDWCLLSTLLLLLFFYFVLFQYSHLFRSFCMRLPTRNTTIILSTWTKNKMSVLKMCMYRCVVSSWYSAWCMYMKHVTAVCMRLKLCYMCVWYSQERCDCVIPFNVRNTYFYTIVLYTWKPGITATATLRKVTHPEYRRNQMHIQFHKLLFLLCFVCRWERCVWNE